MSPGQMLPGRMSPLQLESDQDGQDWVSNSWDNADIEFMVVVVDQSHFRVKP